MRLLRAGVQLVALIPPRALDRASAESVKAGVPIGLTQLKAARRVIADLGGDHRHIAYDERARGKSKRSADCSFEGAVRDLATGTSQRSRFTYEKGRP
ncbi:hypothetical protein [Sphaerisporangium sp. TRM90804]|uniref:hypothetical protein n=1 Tax=Sphaerisporangium sp. TRM90804 TaxID=3031113 RepID=UPI00244A99BC|nr:hypothetical protein [Sphaerisporangium sp. TRM90804]